MKPGEYHISVNQGLTWKTVKGQLSRNNNRLLLKCNIDGDISNVNFSKSLEGLAIFDEVIHLIYFLYNFRQFYKGGKLEKIISYITRKQAVIFQFPSRVLNSRCANHFPCLQGRAFRYSYGATSLPKNEIDKWYFLVSVDILRETNDFFVSCYVDKINLQKREVEVG